MGVVTETGVKSILSSLVCDLWSECQPGLQVRLDQPWTRQSESATGRPLLALSWAVKFWGVIESICGACEYQAQDWEVGKGIKGGYLLKYSTNHASTWLSHPIYLACCRWGVTLQCRRTGAEVTSPVVQPLSSTGSNTQVSITLHCHPVTSKRNPWCYLVANTATTTSPKLTPAMGPIASFHLPNISWPICKICEKNFQSITTLKGVWNWCATWQTKQIYLAYML